MRPLRIGVIGYNEEAFDKEVATLLVELGIGKAIAERAGTRPVEVVSGLINFGIPGIAYAVAVANGYTTVGIACEKALTYDCYSADEEMIIGTQWGDESDTFLDYVDVIVRVGGGEQAHREATTFEEWGGKVYAYELDASLV